MQTQLHPKSLDIINACQSADSGIQVFEALCEFPSENLNDMLDMIEHILDKREEFSNCDIHRSK